MKMPKNAAIPPAAEDPIGTYRIIATGDNSGEPYQRLGADQWMRVNTIDVGGYETLTDKDVDALAARAKRVRVAEPGGEWHQQWANWHQHVQNAANAAEAERAKFHGTAIDGRVFTRDKYLDMGAHPDFAQKHVQQQQEALGAYGSAIAGGVRAAGQGVEQVLDRLLVGNEAAANAGYAAQQGRQHAQEEKGGDLPTLEGVVRSGAQMALTGGNVPALIGLAAAESGSQAMSQASAEGYDWDAQARQGLAQAAIEGGVTSAFSLAGKGGWEALAGKLRKSHLAGRAGATAYLRELVAKSTVKPGTKLAKDLVAGVKDVAKDSLWELLEEHTITNLGLMAEQGILGKPGNWRQAAVQANIDTFKQTALMGGLGGVARGAAYGAGKVAGRNEPITRPLVPTTRANILDALEDIDFFIKRAEEENDIKGADTLKRFRDHMAISFKDAKRMTDKAFSDAMRARGWEVLDDATYQQYLDMQEAERKASTPYEMSMDDARHELDAEIFMAALAIRKQGEVVDALPNSTLSGKDLVAEARARLEQLRALRKLPWNADTARAVVDYLNATGRLEDAGRGPQEQYGLVEDDKSPRERMLRNRARMEVQAQRAKIEERAKAEAEQFGPVGGYPEVQGAPMEQGPPYPVLQPQAAQEAVPTQTEPVTEQPPVAQEAAPTQQQLPVDIQESVTQQVTQTPDTPEWVKRADDSSERQAASEARAAARGHRMADMQRGWMAQTPETPTGPTRETHEPAQKQTQASEPTPSLKPNKKKLKWLGEFRVGENTTGHLYYDSEEKKFYEEMNDNTWRPLAHRAYKRATEAYSSNRTIDVWTEATPEHVDELREKAGDKFATYTWGELEEAGGLNIYGKRDKSPQLKYERQLRYALGSKKPRAPKLSDDGDAQGGVAARGPVAPVEPVTTSGDETQEQAEAATPEPEATESVTAPPAQEQSPAQADDTPEALEARGEWRATTPRENVKVGGRLMVIDSGDLITSTDDGYDHSLQARDRQSEASRQAIMQMGANFDPERARYGVTTDSGPAIVVWRDGTERGTDGKPIARGWHVLSGNGRTKGVQEAYAVNRGDAYRGMVRGVSARMGADTNAVDAMKRPQLVRVLDERGGKTDQEIARLSNMDVIQRMSTAEQARMDADAIGPILHLLNPGEDGNLMVAKNAPFLRAFAEAVHDESLIGTDGGWSPTIEKRIQAAVLASLFENTAENRRVLSVALEDADALGVRKILNAVLSEGPKLAAQADTKPDYGVMRELGRSLMGYIRYRQQLLSGQVKSLQDFLDQVDMFDSWSPVEGALIRGMDERGGGKGGSAAKVRTWLGRYQQLVAARDTSTGSLLGDEPSPDEGKLELLQMAGNDAAWDGMTWVGDSLFASLAGPNAAGADGTRLETAILMQSFGFSREDIFSETGWWEIVPGQWVFEVDASKGKLVGDVDHYTGALQGIYANDELYRQYPDLRNVPVKIVVYDRAGFMSVDEGGLAGVGSIEVRARTKRDAELTLLHEIQHLIQDIENHGRGTSLQDAQVRAGEQKREAERLKNTPEYQQAEQALNDAYAKYFMGELDEAGLSALEKRLREDNVPYRQMVKVKLLSDDYRSYLAYTGEAESRLVQMRRVMTKAARKAEPPWVTLENMLRAEGLLPEGQKPEDVLHTTHKRAPVIYARRINVEVNRLLREAGVRGRMSIEVVDEVGRMTDAEAAAHGVAPGTRKAADVDTATGRARLYRGATLQDAAHEVAHWFWDSGLLTAQERAAVEAEFGDLGQRANHEAAAKAAAAWWSSREGKPNTFVRRAWAKLVRLAKAVARAMGGKVSVEDVFEGMYGGHIARREANAARGLLRARGDYASPRFTRANAPHPGQKGWSEYADMSARAEEALARGLKTADMIAKEYGVTAAVVKATLRPAEWHHVLMRGRKTPPAVDFYDFDPSEEDSPDAARLADMRERVARERAEAKSVNALAKAAKAGGFVVKKDMFGASVMRPGESLASGRITANRIDIYPHDDGGLRAVAERLGMRHDAEADVYLGRDMGTYASAMGDTDAAYGTPDHALVELQRKLDALPTMAEKQAALDLWRFENQDVVREIEGTQDARLASEGFNSPVLYRGDMSGKTSFTGAEDASVRLKGNIFMFDDPKLAKFYTKERTNYLRPVETIGPKDGLYAMQANLGSRVFTMDAKGAKWSAIQAPREIGGKKENPYGIQIDDLAEAIKAKGYTAMVVKNVGDQAGWGTQYVVFSPEQIAIRTSPLTLNPDGRLAGLEQGETRASAMGDVDAAYMDAVDRGDMETAQRMVDQAATASGLPVISDDGISGFKIRREAPPKKTIKAYKLFRADNGLLYPLFVHAKEAFMTGVWLDAGEGPRTTPTVTGIQQVKSSLGGLSYRPGFHAGDIPYAPHIGAKQPGQTKPFARKHNEVWAEVEVAADVDYQAEADANGMNAKGKFVEVNADIKHLPKDGFYRYKTNSNMNGKWIITGSMKINRVLSEDEVNAIIREAGHTPMPWARKGKGNDKWNYVESLDLDNLRLDTREAESPGKLNDPITYDDAGNVIPLSQRFNADSPDIRYRDVDEIDVIASNATKKSTLVDVGRLNRLGRRLFGEEWFSLRDKVLKPGGREVEGRYWNAWADISTGKGNPEDTLYHEAYHRLEDLYLTDAELAILRKAVPDAEARAEGFVSFAHGRGGVTGRVRAVFSTLMRRLRQLLGMRKQLDQLHDVYDRLARGYYAGREKVGSVADAPAWAEGENKNYAEKEAWYNNPEQLEGDTPYGRLSPRRRVLGSGPRLVASIVGKEFKAAGYQRLSGRTINVLDDLAEIAQVWRDPRYETFRIVYVDENNKIMHHEAITSHMPDRTASTPRAYNNEVFRRELRRRENRIKRLGAAGIWFVHNHPSGKVEASNADIKMTNYLKDLYGALYRGHLIINHNKYSLVNRWGSVEYHLDGYRGEDAPDPLKPNQEVINGVRLGEYLSNVDTIDIVRNMQQVPGEIPFLMIDNANRIVALSSIPRSMLTVQGVPTVLNTLRRWGRATGATGAVMMFPGESAVDVFKGEVFAAYEAGLKFKLLHMVFIDGYVHDGQHRMFSDLDMITTRVNEPSAQYRDVDAATPTPPPKRLTAEEMRRIEDLSRDWRAQRGRPDLANPAAGISEPTEAVVNAVDQVRPHVVQHDDEAAREAEAILAQHGGPRGMLALALRKAASGEAPSAGETIALKRTLTDLGHHAHVTGDEADLRDTINMAHAYRQMGTVLGREMRLRREDMNPLATLIESMYEPTEPERMRRTKLDDAIRGYEEERLNLPEQLREQILRATMSEQERIEAINKAIRERDGSSPNPAVVRELARLYGARDRVIRRMARRAQGIIKALQGAGLHPGDAEIWSRDPASVIRAKRIISVRRADMSDKLFELRLAAMLSGPLTHVKNTVSNAAMMTWELTAQRGVEMALNSILRDSKSPSIGELPHMLRGILPGMVQGTRAAWGILLTEDYAGTRMDREEHWRGPAVGGVVGRVARGLSLTPMTAADQWFKHIAAHVEVQARAYRIAKSQGLTGDALTSRMQELIADPASVAWTEAIAFAHHVTFQSELGRSGQSLMRARSATPGARHVFPFVTTNANLLKNIVRKSPLGALNMIYTVLRGGYTGSRDTAITHAAEQVLAWTVGGAMALTLGLWDDEEEPLVTGSAPWIATSRGERDLAYRDAPPNSIRTGEHTWRSYMAIEPFGPTLGILVDGLQAMRQAPQTGQYDVVARRAAQRVGSLIMDRTVMTGVSDLIQTLQSGEPGDYITSFLASWVPNIVRQSVRAGDTAIRDTSDMPLRDRLAHEALPSGDSVPARYDAWGQPVTKAGGYADRLLSPTRLYDTGGRSPVARRVDTMLRVWNRRNPRDTWAPGPPQRGSMTVQQYERYARIAGERALKLLARKRLNYANPTEADIQAVQDALEQARRWAKERL